MYGCPILYELAEYALVLNGASTLPEAPILVDMLETIKEQSSLPEC